MFGTSPSKKFFKAVAAGDTAAMAELLDKGMHIDTRNGNGETALRLAVANNDIATVRFLIDKGANPNVQTRAGLTPLSRAAGQGYNAILKILLDIPGIDVDLQDNDGNTPLRLATVNNQTESVKLLLEKSANPNIQNNDGNTPLIRAVAQGYTEITKLLLQARANPDIRNNALMTAADFAVERGQSATLKILRSFTAEATDEAPTPALPAAVNDDTPVLPTAAWHVTDELEIARVAQKPALGKEVTDIFNFRAGRVITIIKDLQKASETTLEKNFTDVENTGWIAEAADAYAAQTGTRPAYDSGMLQKPKAQLPPKPNKNA
jgi:ankyrin repeat protein